jgi:uncharacterized protein (TIGR02598 family)
MKRNFLCNRAFSLVEVVLALGVVAFAIVAILGMFPIALTSNRSSINESRAAELVRAITGTIDSQCATFGSINCYGKTLDLASLSKSGAPVTLYASYPTSYPGPGQPTIGTSATNSVYSIELRFDNNPPLSPGGPGMGTGKLNLIEIRVYGKSRSEGSMEFFYLARNKG